MLSFKDNRTLPICSFRNPHSNDSIVLLRIHHYQGDSKPHRIVEECSVKKRYFRL